jgi:hypothetical protein
VYFAIVCSARGRLVYMCVCLYIYIYIHTHTHTHTYTHTYTYIHTRSGNELMTFTIYQNRVRKCNFLVSLASDSQKGLSNMASVDVFQRHSTSFYVCRRTIIKPRCLAAFQLLTRDLYFPRALDRRSNSGKQTVT